MDPLSRVPTMFINRAETTIARVDPFKKAFRSMFDMLPDSARGHVVAFLAELIGTISFLLFAFGGGEAGAAASNDPKDGGQGEHVSTAPPGLSPELLLYISLSAGFSMVVNAWVFFRISGGLFNPAVSFGMALIGAITWARCATIIVAQTVGAIVASYIVYALFNGGLHTATTLGGGTSPAQGVVIEMLLTALVSFTIFMLAAEPHEGSYLAPIGIGLSVFIAQLVGFFWTGASLNPVRSLAPCIVNRSFTSYHWIYWVGPISGVILAVLLFKLVKALEYETVNGDRPEPLVAHNDQKQPLTVPMTSVTQATPGRKPSVKETATIQIRNPSATASPQVNKDEKKQYKKVEQSVLPECYAD